VKYAVIYPEKGIMGDVVKGRAKFRGDHIVLIPQKGDPTRLGREDLTNISFSKTDVGSLYFRLGKKLPDGHYSTEVWVQLSVKPPYFLDRRLRYDLRNTDFEGFFNDMIHIATEGNPANFLDVLKTSGIPLTYRKALGLKFTPIHFYMGKYKEQSKFFAYIIRDTGRMIRVIQTFTQDHVRAMPKLSIKWTRLNKLDIDANREDSSIKSITFQITQNKAAIPFYKAEKEKVLRLFEYILGKANTPIGVSLVRKYWGYRPHLPDGTKIRLKFGKKGLTAGTKTWTPVEIRSLRYTTKANGLVIPHQEGDLSINFHSPDAFQKFLNDLLTFSGKDAVTIFKKGTYHPCTYFYRKARTASSTFQKVGLNCLFHLERNPASGPKWVRIQEEWSEIKDTYSLVLYDIGKVKFFRTISAIERENLFQIDKYWGVKQRGVTSEELRRGIALGGTTWGGFYTLLRSEIKVIREVIRPMNPAPIQVQLDQTLPIGVALGNDIREGLIRQYQQEIQNALFYHNIATVAQKLGYVGWRHLFWQQGMEEYDHAYRILRYIMKHRIAIGAVSIPPLPSFAELTIPTLVSEALGKEKENTVRIHVLYEKAKSAEDTETATFLEWFVREQKEEEEKFVALINEVVTCGGVDRLNKKYELIE